MPDRLKVLIVAAHPDDEVLGCGGVIARHADAGDCVDIVFVADGVTARDGQRTGLDQRREAARKAAGILGARPPRFFDYPDNRLDSVALLDIVKAIEQVASEFAPVIAYTHHGSDLNVDHRVVHQAVMTALRPLPGSATRGLFAFETLSSTEWSPAPHAFRPDRYVDIQRQVDRKLAAFAAYGAEARPFPHPRSPEAIRALATLRGASSGLHAAEAFETLRWIEG
jgi:LmbE family N-acetylglucosaminyl deacetylase